MVWRSQVALFDVKEDQGFASGDKPYATSESAYSEHPHVLLLLRSARTVSACLARLIRLSNWSYRTKSTGCSQIGLHPPAAATPVGFCEEGRPRVRGGLRGPVSCSENLGNAAA